MQYASNVVTFGKQWWCDIGNVKLDMQHFECQKYIDVHFLILLSNSSATQNNYIQQLILPKNTKNIIFVAKWLNQVSRQRIFFHMVNTISSNILLIFFNYKIGTICLNNRFYHTQQGIQKIIVHILFTRRIIEFGLWGENAEVWTVLRATVYIVLMKKMYDNETRYW